MLIRKIVLTNFGLYGGCQEFDLVPRVKYRKQRPIILFGGKNGAGKTTLLESVRLALYGRTSLGSRVRLTDYHSYLRGRIHRARGDLLPATGASVAIEFDYVRGGEKLTYRVERSWEAKGEAGVEERFELLENGRPVHEVDREVTEAFVREIIPEGLSQLFFFDGEKIRELAEDASGDQVLARSIKALLGLDVVERLSADLAIYTSRQAADIAGEEERTQLASIASEIDQLEAASEAIEDELDQIESDIDGVTGEIDTKEKDLKRSGADLAKHREEFKSAEIEIAARVHETEAGLRALCDGVLPLTLCPRSAVRVFDQIEAEAAGRRSVERVEALQTAREELADRLKPVIEAAKQTTKGTSQALVEVESIIEAYFVERTGAERLPETPPYLGLSESDTGLVRSQLEEAKRVREQTLERCRQLEVDYRKLQEARLQLQRVPDDEPLAEIFEQIQELNRELGEQQQRRSEAEARAKAAGLQLADLERRKTRIEERVAGQSKANLRLELAGRTRAALDQYLQRLTERKVDDLRGAFVECFNRLARKGDVIHDIQIDPQTFATTLFDRLVTPIPKAELSSGEKQIYAIAMLWALARTSGRPLPVIIDTPLSRLDSEHRAKLCEIYFPEAAHQVILLSTDTEVDQSLFKTVSPNISHSYHLQFNRDQVRTSATEEYFWKEPAHV